MDSWEKWRVVCLAILSVEDVEDLYLFGTMITGFLLIGLGIFLVYRKNQMSVPAVKSPTMLPESIDGGCKVVSAQTVERAMSTLAVAIDRNMDNTVERLIVIISRKMDTTLEAVHALTVVSNRNMGNILEKFSALQRRMNDLGDQNGQTE